MPVGERRSAAPCADPTGDRLSRLSQASLRVNESLGVDTALRAVMDGARSLTRSPYAAITTLDDCGRVEDHLALSLDPGDVERLWQAPEGLRLFEYLNALPGPLRVGLPAVSRIPVIFLSAYGRDELAARILEKGAIDYIVKPFSPTELVARVRAALRRFGEPETRRRRSPSCWATCASTRPSAG